MWNSIKTFASTAVGYVNWTTSHTMPEAELDKVRALLTDNYYIILTRHDGHLSAYAVALAHRVLTGKPGYYAHVLLNVEDGVTSDNDYEFIEATIEGVHYSKFSSVFDPQVSGVCLMKPKPITIEEWTGILDKARSDLGKPYDLALDPTQSKCLNCVELVRDALQAEPHYTTAFSELENMIKKYGNNLDPHMIYDCSSFEIVYEYRA
jgi:hypothetical protein